MAESELSSDEESLDKECGGVEKACLLWISVMPISVARRSCRSSSASC